MLFLDLKKKNKKEEEDEECVGPCENSSLAQDLRPTPTRAGEPLACDLAWDADWPAGWVEKIPAQQKLQLDSAAFSTSLGAPSIPNRPPRLRTPQTVTPRC